MTLVPSSASVVLTFLLANGCRCQKIDKCSAGVNTCHQFATCFNSNGSDVCQCLPDYRGDGITCQAICDGGCRNGGKCVYPNVCECRHGYIGSNCELDIDECELDIDACSGHSACINQPGFYKCDCIQGFHSNWADNHYGNLCLDLNECVGEGSGHTCHPSSQCFNKEGSYACRCEPEDSECSQSCVYEGHQHKNGTLWISEVDKCMDCMCESGVTTCRKSDCACDDPAVDLFCCPHCDLTAQCQHQEFPVFLNNGEKWLFQCQTCECLFGEIDCWPLECPPLTCDSVVQLPGDCCPRCENGNPCLSPNYDSGGVDHSAFTCLHDGQHFSHGDLWVLESSPCTNCECKAGHICCSFNQTCMTSSTSP